MKTALKLTGHHFSLQQTLDKQACITLASISKREVEANYFWNANTSEPLFLKFYKIASKRDWLFTKGMQLVFFLHLQRFFFKQKKWFYTLDAPTLFDCNGDWTLCTSTVGLYLKNILYAHKTCYKIASSAYAESLIQNEYQILKKIQETRNEFITPLVHRINSTVIQLSDITEKRARTNRFTDAHWAVLKEMTLLQKQHSLIGNWSWFKTLEWEFLEIHEDRIPKNLIRKITMILEGISNYEKISLSLSHGAFTSANLFQAGNTLALHNWENASFDRPYAFDYFHFVFYQGGIIDRKNWSEIYNDLKEQCVNSQGQCLFENEFTVFKTQLKWYLLTHVMDQLKMYSELPEWSSEMLRWLELWNEALDDLVMPYYSIRDLVVMDFFDSIQNAEYGALQLLDGPPEKWHEKEVLKIVTRKYEASKMLHFLSNHHLVKTIYVQKKSHEYKIEAVLTDDSCLSFLLIWQLKVKTLEIMNAHEVFQNNFVSPFGIKHARNIDSARFVVLTSQLLKVTVPSHFRASLEVLKKSQHVFDLEILACCKEDFSQQNKLYQIIKNKPKNQSFNYLKNVILYGWDTVKTHINKGEFSSRPIQKKLQMLPL
ncbi:hypothetical protein [Flavobacterium sp. TSSA_36]|uniref:hypothetical protein n=1 Tax=Flavobacterium sp. TSSA_36 TaxID=3447669 RepID=UPI003F2AC7DE